jgi:hypothetical protein
MFAGNLLPSEATSGIARARHVHVRYWEATWIVLA